MLAATASRALWVLPRQSPRLLQKGQYGAREFLRPEFLGRVDEIVVFKDLDEGSLVKISELMLNELVSSLSDKGITLKWTDSVFSRACQAG
jgi:ATP-dependent Clp protease ATP-binding subunit ClpA